MFIELTPRTVRHAQATRGPELHLVNLDNVDYFRNDGQDGVVVVFSGDSDAVVVMETYDQIKKLIGALVWG